MMHHLVLVFAALSNIASQKSLGSSSFVLNFVSPRGMRCVKGGSRVLSMLFSESFDWQEFQANVFVSVAILVAAESSPQSGLAIAASVHGVLDE